jgi:hypothetical protein
VREPAAAICDDAGMPPRGSLGVAFAAWKMWQRLPPKQRTLLLREVRRHGPKAAAALAALVKSRRRP